MRRWTPDELRFAVMHCTCWTHAAIARALGRTPGAVKRQLWQRRKAPTRLHLLTSSQVAKRTGYSQQWITRLARRGVIKARRVPGGRWWLFPEP